MVDALEKVIRPIVEGQVRDFLNSHPEIVDAVKWFKPRKDKRQTFINSLSKRIVRDLCCPISRGRLAAAIMERPTVTPPDVSVEPGPAARPTGLATLPEPVGAAPFNTIKALEVFRGCDLHASDLRGMEETGSADESVQGNDA